MAKAAAAAVAVVVVVVVVASSSSSLGRNSRNTCLHAYICVCMYRNI